MQSISHEFTRPASPPLPYLNPITSNNLLVHTSFDANIPANKVIHVTNYNNVSSVPADSILEESCDSYLDSDPEDHIDGKTQCDDVTNVHCDDVTSTQLSFIEALNKVQVHNNNNGVKTESLDPYHIPARFQSPTLPIDHISPQKELKNLIKEVETSSTAQTPDYSSLDRDYSPIDSPVIDKLTEEVPRIEIIEEPETTYRARYESEGCKGPIHGSSETGFPTVKIIGYVGEVMITVYVVTRDNEPHLHTATGPGSTKSSCKEVVLDDGTPAVQMVLKPLDENDEMTAVFDQLSVRRVRNWEADRELRKRGIDPASWKSKKKEAKLAFQAAIKPTNYHPGYVLTTYSRTFLCTAPSGNPEIWWASLTEGSPEGGEELGLIGKKFASGFKIRFFSKDDDGEFWEVFAEVDRAKSNLNACVVKVPPYKEATLVENIVVYVEIRVGPEKEPRCSDPYPFTYLATKTNEKCENCAQIKGLLQRVFAEKAGDIPNGLSLHVEDNHAVSLNGGMESAKLVTNSAVKDMNQTQTPATNHSIPATLHTTANLSSGMIPLLQPYVVKSGDIVSIVDGGASRTSDIANNVGLVYVQKVPDTNNMPIMLHGTKPLAISNNMNLHTQKLVLSQQAQNMTLNKLMVPQTVNGVSVSLTNHVPLPSVTNHNSLPSIVQLCSVNTSVFPTLTRTAAGVTSIPQHTPTHQILHVVSENHSSVNAHQVLQQRHPIKAGTPTQRIPPTQFLINGVPVQTHPQFIDTIQVTSCKAPQTSANDKVRFVNSSHPTVMNSVVYVKTDNTPAFNHVKQEEPQATYLTLQHRPVSNNSSNSFPFSNAQQIFAANNSDLNNRSQTNMVFASASVASAFCQGFHSQSHPLAATQTITSVNPQSMSDMLRSPQHNVQLTNSTTMLPHEEKEIQIINKHIQNLQQELEEKYKTFQEQKQPGYGTPQPSFVTSVNSQIATSMVQSIHPYEKTVQHFDVNASQANHEIPQGADAINHSHGNEATYQQGKIVTSPFPMMHQNISSNHMLGQHENNIQGEQAGIGSSNSVINSSFPNRAQVQNLFVVSPLPSSQMQPVQQPLSLTVFNQDSLLHSSPNNDVFPQQVHKDQSPTQLTSTFQPLQLSPGSQPLQISPTNQQQQLFTSVSNHIISNSHSISTPPSIDDISTVESAWDRPINDAIATNKVGFLEDTNHVKDSQPASPMVLNIHDNDENNFMETLQQLNNDPQQYSSMPPTPVVTFHSANEPFHSTISSFDSNSQHAISRIDSELVDQDEFTSAVSVDYSDAFKNARACEHGSTNWPFQKSDIEHSSEFVQDVTMFSTASSISSSISSQQGW